MSPEAERRFTIQAKSFGQVDAVMTKQNPKTAEAFWKALPIKNSGNRWGDEIYFSTPVSLSEENAKAEVEVGSIAYWPPGKALCIFFGPTPASRGSEPRAASPVNVFAKVVGDPAIFKKFRDGDQVNVQKP